MFRFIRQTPCATLLVVQCIGILLYPFLENSFVGRQVFAIFGLLVMALVIFAIRATPALFWVAVMLAVPAFGLLLTQVLTGNEALLPWASGWEAALYLYGSVSMLRYMLDDEKISRDELFAIPVVFTLLGWSFAHLFLVVQAIDPTSFGATAGDPRTWSDLLFLSFTNVTATGLSDFVPTGGFARSVLIIEQIAGVFYIAMVVSRLVAIGARRQGVEPSTTDPGSPDAN
jgi:hypothetical protein